MKSGMRETLLQEWEHTEKLISKKTNYFDFAIMYALCAQNYYKRYRKLVWLAILFIIFITFRRKIIGFVYLPPLDPIRQNEYFCPVRPDHEPIDVVYTWVNGSDPHFMESIQSLKTKTETSSRRFYEMDQLKYSIRSVEMYAPWVRNIYIVTNGQVPDWLDLTHPRIRVVYHDQIFNDMSDLPTFNSVAIEVNLHHIKDISTNFLYFNDDLSLLRPICLDDFLSSNGTFKLYIKPREITKYGKEKKYSIKCHPACDSLRGNEECNQMCNTMECLYDNGDCDGIEPIATKRDSREAYHNSVDFVNYLLDYQYNTTVTDRTWMPHLPNLINRDIMYQMEADFGQEMKRTSGHQRRSYNDLQYQMMYTYFVIESPHNYPYQLIDHKDHVGYCALTDDYFKNRYRLRKTRNERKKFICLNDDMKHHSSFVAKQTYDLVNKFYSEFYPNASTFEL